MKNAAPVQDTNREIGRILCKSEFTVKTHVQRMLAKTGLDNRLQLAIRAQFLYPEEPVS